MPDQNTSGTTSPTGAGDNLIGRVKITDGTDVADVTTAGELEVVEGPATSFDHGSNRDIDATAEQITTTSVVPKFGVLVKADAANTGILYLGNSDVTAGTTAATDGMPLSAGESVLIKIDNVNKIYAIGSAANQIAYWMTV